MTHPEAQQAAREILRDTNIRMGRGESAASAQDDEIISAWIAIIERHYKPVIAGIAKDYNDALFHFQAERRKFTARLKKLEATTRAADELAANHKHTEECLRYAAQTGKAYCIQSCGESHLAALRKYEESKDG